MDNRCGHLQYAPKPLGVAAAWAGVAAAVAWAVVAAEPEGRVLAIAAVVVLAGIAAFGTLARPRLTAGSDGITVAGLRGRRFWPWSDVRRVEVVTTRRLGRRPGVLELEAVDPDGTEHLVLLTPLDLDADPHDVAARLDGLRTPYNE